MRNKLIKQLAKSCTEYDNLSTETIKYILNNLSKEELKFFLRNYKTALNKKRVYITASSTLDKETLGMLKNIYKNLDLKFNYDEGLGAGIKIQQDDMIIDFTFKKYIEDTINKLK